MPIPGGEKAKTAYWQERVFRNTYTRTGKQLRVRRWSVKIQHQGLRRSFSLIARTKTGAALEARRIYLTVVTQGWDEAARLRQVALTPGAESFGVGQHSRWPKGDVRHWRARLLRRKNVLTTGDAEPETLSAHIEHGGQSAYFSLETTQEARAAARAREIYKLVSREGWEVVAREYRREFTLAIFWADNPIAWTYATLHTVPGEGLVAIGKRSGKSGWKVLLIEPDAGVARAVVAALNHDQRFFVERVCSTLDETLAALVRQPWDLVLINQSMVSAAGGNAWNRLRERLPSLAVMVFSLYEDSDQLFKATPGGASGYMLKRTSPGRLLEPIGGTPGDDALTRQSVTRWCREYFQKIAQLMPAQDGGHTVTRLTPREQEILNLLSKGCVDKEVASMLRISPWTVHGHVKNIFEKLGVHSRTEAVVRFLQK